MATMNLPCKHRTSREGAAIGLAVATVTWIWIAAVDVVLGHPFHTFTMLGGVGWFTLVHYGLSVLYGMVIVAAVHGAVQTPSLMIALTFGLLMLEITFAMWTPLISHRVGSTAWVSVFGGSIVGLLVTIILLARRHPLAAQLRRAEEEH